MNDQFKFLPFLLSLVKTRRLSYLAGIASVIVLNAVDMIPPLIIKTIADSVQTNSTAFNVIPYAIALLGCYLLISLLRLCWRFFLMIPSRHIEHELRQTAYEKLLRSNFVKTSNLKTGDVVSTLSQDLSNLRMFLGPGILIFFDSIAYIFFIPITLFYILGTGAIWVLLPFTLLILIVTFVHKPLEQGYDEISDRLGDLSQYVYEETQGARFFRAEGLIQVRRNKYDIILKSLLSRQINVAKWELGLDGALQLVLQTGYFTVLVLAWQGHGVMAQGIGALTVSIQLLDKLTWPLMSIGYLMNLYQQANTASKKLNLINSLSPKKAGPIDAPVNFDHFELKNLTVRSAEGIELISSINLDIRKGEHIALVGSVGAGKTVLLQALAGLWESDHLNYDHFNFSGVDYKDLNRESYHQILSFIPQTPQIFSRTLGMNISPVQVFNQGKLWKALEQADLSVDVERFPEGLGTLIGEKGMNLSGGQKQRTLIARSFHSQSKVYLWDDSISALDPATEKKIISTLRTLDPDAMLVLATHRLSSLKDFDRIVIIDNGKITKIGHYNEIKKDHALFNSLLQAEQERDKKENA